jgi:hypothetical protein
VRPATESLQHQPAVIQVGISLHGAWAVPDQACRPAEFLVGPEYHLLLFMVLFRWVGGPTRYERASAAIETVQRWFGGLATGAHGDAKVMLLISTILDAERLANCLHDNGDWFGLGSQQESVDLLWPLCVRVT